jgi:signal transduction histidine kinase
VKSLGARLAAGGVQTQIECPAELVVMGNAEEWAVIFTNLIDNSLKHGFRMREQGRIDMHVAQDAHGLRLNYRDDGAGMAPDVLSRIFDPFFTTDLQNGMGLGMHLVYNLVTQRFGGQIRCESTPGDGMRIQIDVPT